MMKECRNNTPETGERHLSMLLVAIVTIFVVCNSLKIVLNFYDGLVALALTSGSVEATSWSTIAGYFSNLLIVLNSAINMIVYCIMNQTFRSHLFNTIKNIVPRLKCCSVGT